MAEKITTIYAVRVDFHNGCHLEYHYAEEHQGAAKECYDTIRVAQRDKLIAEVFDDAGRAAVVKGDDVQAISMVDLVMETKGALAIAEVVDTVRHQMGYVGAMDGQLLGMQPSPPGQVNGGGAPGAIGADPAKFAQ